ncbi:MAG: hypothetical protein IT159_13100 [Bryobacterales bacterium]|nr:hypothetical protein [Bryobacterales bacterium]
MRPVLALAAALSLQAADLPRIYYTKTFPGSVPAYVSVRVDKDGSTEFNDEPAGEQPIRFKLDPPETEAIFALAAKLGDFSRPLESGLKVAFTGTKVFRFEEGATRREVQFNYTTDPDARLLLDWFERLTETAMHNINLERTLRFDRLGLDKALLLLQVSADRGRLAGASQLLPILDRIAGSKSAFNRVQDRAAALAGFIRAGGAPPQ